MSGISISAQVTGLDGVFRKMEEKELAARIGLQRAILRFALLVERIAKDEYVPVISGRLKASIGGQSAPTPQQPGDALFEKRQIGPVFEVLIGSNVVYAAVIEFGRKPGGQAKREYHRDVARTRSKGKSRKASGNGRHGPFLYPALQRAVETGGPVLREEMRKALGLA